ncbi:MAG: hypothetical protein BWK78_05360 [Thiotrichaceae bacterium IS1]|nr:MAG: hypothetical protein BWK78_05360 [Thiotrichaceae bacterium IS1]
MLNALVLGFVVIVLVGILHGVINVFCHAKEITVMIKQWFENSLQIFKNVSLQKIIVAIKQRFIIFTNFFSNFQLYEIITKVKQWVIDFPKTFKNFFIWFSKNPQMRSFGRALGIDLVIGIIMAMIFLLWLHNYPFLADPEDASMDFVMQRNQCDPDTKKCSFSKNENIPPITLLDIDDKTYVKWERPPITPRNHIKELIDSAVNYGAKVIVVDIFMTHRQSIIPKQREQHRYLANFLTQETLEGLYNPAQSHPDDQELYEYLAKYASTYCSNGKKCPIIILIPDLIQQKGQTAGNESIFDIHKQPVFQVQKSFLDEAVEKSSPYIQWASPKFLISPFDNTVRRLWLWHPVCNDQKPQVIPSVHLLVSAIVSNKSEDVGGSLKNVERELHNFVEKDCNPYYKPPSLQKPISSLKVGKGEIAGGGIRQRIVFTMPWPSKQEKDAKKGIDNQKFAFSTQRNESILRVFSVFGYLEQVKSSRKNLLGGRIRDSIVIIGGSHTDAQDIHRTPLGEMPGEFVIANAIYSFLSYGEIRGTSVLEILGFKILLIVLFVAMATFINNMFVSKLPSVLRYWRIVIIILVTAIEWFALQMWFSTELLKEGVWFDFSIPLVAILFHHIASQFQGHDDERCWPEKSVFIERGGECEN